MMDWKGWVKGMVAAAVSGGSSSTSAMLVAPETFNLYTHEGFNKMLVLFGVGAFTGVILYLKQSPVPPDVPVRLIQ